MATKHLARRRRTCNLHNNNTNSKTKREEGQKAKGICFPYGHRNLGERVPDLQEETKDQSNRRILSRGKCIVYYYFDRPLYLYQE